MAGDYNDPCANSNRLLSLAVQEKIHSCKPK